MAYWNIDRSNDQFCNFFYTHSNMYENPQMLFDQRDLEATHCSQS